MFTSSRPVVLLIKIRRNFLQVPSGNVLASCSLAEEPVAFAVLPPILSSSFSASSALIFPSATISKIFLRSACMGSLLNF
jgi:hypothetical protein